MITNGVTYYLVVNAFFDGQLTLGEITMTILGVLAVTIKMQVTFKEIARLKQETGRTKKYMALMYSDIYDKKDEGKCIDFNSMTVEFQNISFKYPGTDILVLNDLSFKIAELTKTALVGINGSGKTTIIKLISGLYAPTSGRILINGIDITTINKEHLRTQLSVVFQDVNIYAASVLENITGESPSEKQRERALETLKEVGMYEKIMSLKHKENHQLLKIIDDEGIDLSGGETQKIAIARALYKENTRLIILDEPTAALDAIAEKSIYENFDDMTENKTAIMISHRLASTRFCDNIIFLEHGKVVEEGSHEELMNIPNGKYQEMFTTQGKYYQEGGNTDEL
jgi:ABC-type multidrug transport system fused ATPase/permease subunit